MIDVGENQDSMYMILDGAVEFFIDLKIHNLVPKDVDDLCSDLSIKKKELIKLILEFKDRAGLNKDATVTAMDI